MKTQTDISNSADIIDSRDIITRIDELRDELDDLIYDLQNAEDGEAKAEALAALDSWLWAPADADLENFTGSGGELERWGRSDEAEELLALEALADNMRGCPNWEHGITLIRESYFREYAEQLADDLGAVNREVSWPYNHIDWDAAAESLKMDYSEVDYSGVTYLVRD